MAHRPRTGQPQWLQLPADVRATTARELGAGLDRELGIELDAADAEALFARLVG